jgi:hypothetical protein
MDELMEGHDDVNACVRTYNNNITTLSNALAMFVWQ